MQSKVGKDRNILSQPITNHSDLRKNINRSTIGIKNVKLLRNEYLVMLDPTYLLCVTIGFHDAGFEQCGVLKSSHDVSSNIRLDHCWIQLRYSRL